MGIIGVEMVPSVVRVDDITNGQCVYREEDGPQDGALGDTASKWVECRLMSRYCDTLGPIREIGWQPVEKGRAGKAKSGVEAVQET